MYTADGLGNPGLIGFAAIPGAVKSVAGSIEAQRVESHIADRVRQYQSLTAEQLQQVLARGGEAGEAARRVLATRGGTFVAPASAAPFDLSKYIKLPEVSTTSKVEIPQTFTWLALAAVGLGAFALMSKRAR